MTRGNSEGTRRCDARCYNAKGDECDCICRGKNHGAGLDQAVQNMRDLFFSEDKQKELIDSGILADLKQCTVI